MSGSSSSSFRVFKPRDFGVPILMTGLGTYLPSRIVSNEDLVAMGAPLTPDEMIKLCGIESRHFAAENEATSDLAIAACKAALARAEVSGETIERLIVATVSSDYMSPSTACLVQHGLGLRTVPSFDVTASCSGFLFGLENAARAIATGDAAALVVAADIRSRFVDVRDRGTCALFGDGAGAAILSRGSDPSVGVVAIGLLTDGSGAHSVYVPSGGSRSPASQQTIDARSHFIRMDAGPQVYLAAVEGMLGTAKLLLDALGMSFEDIHLIIPHQPNKRILDRLARLAGLEANRVFVNIERVGNISGATVPVAFDAALASGTLSAGDRVLLLSAGAGYTAGAALVVVDEALLSRYST